MRSCPKLSTPGPRADSLPERRLEALEIRFAAPPPLNIADKIIGLALRRFPTEDLQLLIGLAKEYAAGTPREMSELEIKAHEVFEAALKRECRRAGIGSLQEFERLLEADHNTRGARCAGSWLTPITGSYSGQFLGRKIQTFDSFFRSQTTSRTAIRHSATIAHPLNLSER